MSDDIDDEPTSPQETELSRAWREVHRHQKRFVIAACLVLALLLPVLVAAGTIVRRAIELAPVVNNASTSCLTVCCRPFNERQVSK